MNIFFLDENPKLAAEYLCDKHVVKMVLETAQLLSTAHRKCPKYDLPDFIYKAAHKNHPASIWTRENTANYLWLAMHGLHLCNEYTFRYDKVHKSQRIIGWCLTHLPQIMPTIHLSSPVQCMPEECKIPGNPVEAYRKYYCEVKLKSINCVWTKREKPNWLQIYQNKESQNV